MNQSANTEEYNSKVEDSSVVLRINRLDSAGAEHLQNTTRFSKRHPSATVELSKLASKSEDSLDSGIYTRQKSHDSMDSLDSNESGFNGDNHSVLAQGGLSPMDEGIPSLPSQYEDYLRECQDIRQSIIVSSNEEEKQPVSRTDSGDEPDDDTEVEWLRMAGLSDLVVPTSGGSSTNAGNPSSSRISTDSLSSMTVLSTLTRPQREAVLRRITSFNRAQKIKKRPKPTISAIFPTIELEAPKSPAAVSPQYSPDRNSLSRKNEDALLKSTSLPRDALGFGDGGYPRRYSEITRPISKDLDNIDSPSRSAHLNPGRHKRHLASIVATESTGGIETLRISSKGPDVDSWGSSKEEVGLQDPDESKEKAMSYTETADQANLPNFSLVKDRLGITKISDLSSVDMRKVQSLALIELTALFDLRGIDLKRRKSGKLKIKESGVFGIPLTTLVEWDQKRLSEPSLRVPLLLQDIVTFLQENAIEDEGILRKSGSSARIKALKQNVDLRYGYSNIAQDVVVPSGSQVWTDAHPNDIAALLKQFLRELPDPLLTTEYIEAFQSCGLIRERKEQLQALNLLIILLNEVHRDSLKVLLKFLERVVAAEQSNKMSLNNVAMITAPNLFMARKQSKKETISSTSQDLRHAAGTSNIVRMLIKYNKLLWTVPAFMLTQVRHMNRAEMSSKKPAHQKEKHKMKFFQGKAKDPSKKSNLSITHQPFDFETPKGVIRVQAPDMIMTSMAVQLDANITAGDIIARFKRQCERINPKIEIDDSTHALFEVGGNINERCLDPETNMSVLMRVNPEATLFIKPRI